VSWGSGGGNNELASKFIPNKIPPKKLG